MLRYTKNGYTGEVSNNRTIVHSPDGHIILCRRTNIKTEEDLKLFMIDLYGVIV